MERITIETRTTKGKSLDTEIKIRFRVRDGRDVQLFVKSDLVATVRDLTKFEIDGRLKNGVKIYNNDLLADIQEEIGFIRIAYNNLKDGGYTINSEALVQEIEDVKHPEKKERLASPNLLDRFNQFVEDRFVSDPDGATKKGYNVVGGILKRFLIINGIRDLKCMDFGATHLNAFRVFCKDEYKYVNNWRQLYVETADNNVPSAPRADNTVASKLKHLRCFFTALEDNDEIVKSPFKKIGTSKREEYLKETYEDEIASLTYEELMQIKNAVLPEPLRQTRDAFLLQCYIGARISDYKTFSMENVHKTEGGFAFLSYTPRKTARHRKSIDTPLVKSAYDIICKYDFKFSVLAYVGGESGYNAKIKRVFKEVGITRDVKVWDETKKQFVFVPISEIASSKTARKTCVTLCVQHSNNENAAGLHSKDSEAIKHYHNKTLGELFTTYCRAFGESITAYIND